MYFVPDGTKVCGFYECENCKVAVVVFCAANSILC